MKKCPNCYNENPDSANICLECGYEFDDIEIHYESSDAYAIECRICGCVYNVPHFDSRVERCNECGCDLSEELPQIQISPDPCIYLERMANKKRYVITSSNKTILGRGIQGEINEESFNTDEFSRKECSVKYQNGLWVICAENSHGHLRINNEDLPYGHEKTLNNGDIITIYKRRFKVMF